MPDFASRTSQPGSGYFELLDEAAQTPNSTLNGPTWNNLQAVMGGTTGATFYLIYDGGPLSVGQTLDVTVMIRTDPVGSFIAWSSFTQLTSATAPRQEQLITVDSTFGVAHVNNGNFNSGIEAFRPFGDCRIRGVLSAGTGTPQYRVLLAAFR